jgi:hypothetical protein
MPDILVKDIDPDIAERIKRMARDRGWPINDVVLSLLRQALGMEKPEMPLPEDEESRALKEAIEALHKLG